MAQRGPYDPSSGRGGTPSSPKVRARNAQRTRPEHEGTPAQCAENATTVPKSEGKIGRLAQSVATPATCHAQSCSKRSALDRHASTEAGTIASAPQ